MRAILAAARACVLLALAVLLASGCGSQEATVSVPTPSQARTELAGSPAALAGLHRQAAQLLGGGLPAFRARLATLSGRPVVVNAWASWCPPCRSEMPYFARLAVRLGRRVAFLGVNAGDTDGDARRFLTGHWIPYPSYEDPHYAIANAIGVRAGLPTTAFYGRDGRVAFVHQGQYPSEAALAADVRRYAGAA
jgi:cytochrome c biogenesis protein CcmG, thiol:disulfide interchange protein DsbE